jgi:hypothetical protein
VKRDPVKVTALRFGRPAALRRRLLCVAVSAALAGWGAAAVAQQGVPPDLYPEKQPQDVRPAPPLPAPPPASPSAPQPRPQVKVPAAATSPSGPIWSQLTADQRKALAPLQRDWSTIDANRKRKWLEVAAKFPSMPAEERTRVQERMADWARMTPDERGRARESFQQARRVTPQERQAKWQEYQALPPDQRRELANSKPPADDGRRADPRSVREVSQSKSNIVPNPAFAAPPKRVAPTVVQAKPGATTTLMSKTATPPAHQQTGLPKITASPGFVDATTLLPRRGPQGAAARAASTTARGTEPIDPR